MNVETPLTLAATKPRSRDVMMALVGGGAFLDFRNRRGLTAVHVAADCGNHDAIRVSETIVLFSANALKGTKKRVH